jgi:hypothetical protein
MLRVQESRVRVPMLFAMLKLLVRLTAGVVFVLAATAAGPVSNGVFALQGGTSHALGFMQSTPLATGTLGRRLDLWMTPKGERAPLRRYALDMTKYLHLIVVSDDFTHFAHLHPNLASDGHFRIDDVFPDAGRYHIYADGEPSGMGEQVFRFDLQAGGPSLAATRFVAPTGPTQVAGPYEVTLSDTTLRAGQEGELDVEILHDGRAATDLHPYLGALAHAVFLNAGDLSYVHVHPTALGDPMGDMAHVHVKALPPTANSSPHMRLMVDLHERGRYRLWLQFRGGTELYVVPFTVQAK